MKSIKLIDGVMCEEDVERLNNMMHKNKTRKKIKKAWKKGKNYKEKYYWNKRLQDAYFYGSLKWSLDETLSRIVADFGPLKET